MATDYDSVGTISTDYDSNSEIVTIDNARVKEVVMKDVLSWIGSIEDRPKKVSIAVGPDGDDGEPDGDDGEPVGYDKEPVGYEERGTFTRDVIEDATVEEGQPMDVVETTKISFKLKREQPDNEEGNSIQESEFTIYQKIVMKHPQL
ncbi:hypothetical protein P691DRAFT_765964 [Macrolepiota fuliginosa MF-IS2]|uniref:Uncharacterized protein n=1 Tax=Macrolepiota fuliginosa MF-IS2 TaxID=1400762 RepID=A0A9P5X2K6_9AGAR|nr:hypothetical protein P691DRAFT_765964 [Macrolepiota fuliginosa MF-IS2]